jgi:glycosyltransferase involved in cell wall biosynthesis
MNRTKQKMLFICPCTPNIKGTGWEQRAFSFLNAYSNFLDIELWFSPSFNSSDLSYRKKLIDICKSIVTFKRGSLNYKADASYRNAVQRADCVHTFRFFLRFEHNAILWDFDELPRQIIKKSSGNFLERSYVPENFLEMRKKSKVAFSSSHVEKAESLGNIIEIPNVYDTNITNRRDPDENTLLFVGNMGFQPNINAIHWFAKEVLPVLPKNIRFRVVGRRPQSLETESLLLKLAINRNIDFVFDVDDCNVYYETVLAAIVPILNGGGTKLKVLEAFANHCPVISTSKGIEGLNVTKENEVLIANTANEFKEAILKVNKMSNQLSEIGFQYLVKNHSQKIVQDRILGTLTQQGIF